MSPSTEEEARNCFAFSLPDDNEGAKSPSRDIQILNELSDRLRTQGFQVGNAGPAKPRGAVSAVEFEEHSVEVLLVATGIDGAIRCEVLTWSHKPRRRRAPSEVVGDQWEKACAAIEKILRLDTRVSSLARLTEDELDELSSKAGY
jgi:hypothetical protein